MSEGVRATDSLNLNLNTRPNIIIVLADDMGYGDLGSYGSTGYSTPNLDKMASEGRRFTNFNVAQAICSASRAAILTGCYSNRVGIDGALNPLSEIGLNPDEETIAEILKKVGYQTAIFGKWHLGNQKEFLPTKQGFDEYMGLAYSNDMWHLDYDGTEATFQTNPRKASFPPLSLLDGDKVIKEIRTLEDQAELTTAYTERAIKFIVNNKDKPFFLYLPHSMPHVPLAVSDKFKGKSKQGLYGDVIMELDWSVGEIMKTLKSNHLDKNTLVIFTSDNGPWFNFGSHSGSAGALREGKATSWEGGSRVPAIMKWPAYIPAGTICNDLSSTIDLLPTISQIAGASLPKARIDGVNILSLLTSQPSVAPRSTFYYYYGKDLEAVRNNNWKLVLPHEYRTYEGYMPGENGLPGKTGLKNTQYALYDLRRDPGERYDVQQQHPEIVKKLMELAKEAREDLGDGINNIAGANVRKPGRLVNNQKQTKNEKSTR